LFEKNAYLVNLFTEPFFSIHVKCNCKCKCNCKGKGRGRRRGRGRGRGSASVGPRIEGAEGARTEGRGRVGRLGALLGIDA